MKKIEKLNIHFETETLPTQRHKLEALHDKINECVRAINLMHGHLDPYVEYDDEYFEYNLNGDPYYGKKLDKKLDWMIDPEIFLIDSEEEKKLLKKHSVDKAIKGDKVLFEDFMYNEVEMFNIVGVGIPMVSDDPEKDLKEFFSKSALLYYGLWQKKATFKERLSGKLFSNIKLISYGKVFMGLKDKEKKEPVWYFENVQLSFEKMHDFDKLKDNNIFSFEQINLAVLENGKYQVEKWRTKLTEIKIGCNLHNDYFRFFPHNPVDDLLRTGKECRFGDAKITFVHAEDETYYMKPNEILFLSECDDIYARGIKK